MSITTLQTQQFIENIQSGNFDKAIQFANDISQKSPENPLGYAMLGDALKQKGDIESATSFYRYSLQKQHSQPGVHIALGEAYVLNGETGKAYESYYQALKIASDNASVLQKTGGFLLTVGQLEEAKILLEKSLEMGNKSAIASLLDLNLYSGESENIELFMKRYSSELNVLQDDLAMAKANFSLGKYEQVIDTLEKVNISHRNNTWKSGYFNILASAYEKLGDFKKAFENFEHQNSNNPYSYDAERMEQQVELIFDQCHKIPSLKLDESLIKDPAFSPLFIIGLPRSGTTLVEQILNTSSHVIPGGELHFIEAAYNKQPSDIKSLTDLAKWYREKIEFITVNYPFPKTAPRWITDKMPTNFMYLGFIKKLLPDAQFVFCERNAMDNGLSIFKQNFMGSHTYSTSLTDIAHFMSVEKRVMNHWKQHFSNSIHTINYEKLVNDFECETKKLFEFSDLKWTPEVNQFYNNKTFSNTASRDQVRQPLHANSIGFHKKYKQELLPLAKAIKAIER